MLLLLWSSELTLDSGPRQDANPLRWAAPLPFGLILGLAAAGLVALGWRGTGGWPVWSTVLACAVAPVVFYVSSRYRLPFASVLCLPAGAGLAALLRPPAESTPRRRTVVWLVLVGIAGLSMVPVAGGMLARADAAGLVQRGIAWTRTGHVERAEADFRSAVEHFEEWAPAHFYLAELLDRNGRGGEAEVIYRRALELQPDYANAACYLGQMLSLGGRPDEALPLLRQGLESHPFHEVCWHHLVGARALTGNASEAAGEAARAADLGVELDPRLVEAVKAMATSPPDDAGAGSENGSAGDTDEQE